MEIEAFMIVEIVEEIEDVIVRGRAYIDIGVGDVLYVKNRYEEKIPCIIEKMSSYGRETKVLNSMMTGDVTLKFLQNVSLKNICTNYKRNELKYVYKCGN
ncbi:hypothetical protein NNC19_12705 [Clostridium sp. SHJSY1]|uniref:hypothetical protein n=1 Tax=Clostridium sp. SHJSY1 TaxID=2942483 RepID=UPI00287643E0|nr:hypothetical protein [Clostridium sp. SHJSY1]MDS0526544.1 hypothetical protein [Clostridium sp. SHJSY1]